MANSINYYSQYPYTDYQKINLDWLMDQDKKQDESIASLDTRVTALEEGGTSSDQELFFCVYGTTTNAEIEAAITNNKLPVMLYNGFFYVISSRISATQHVFFAGDEVQTREAIVSSDIWTSTVTDIAPLNSPAFTGTPTAPHVTMRDDSTKIATTSYVCNNTLRIGLMYTSPAAFQADIPSNKLGALPVNRIYIIGASNVNADDEPVADFVGVVFTLSFRNGLEPGCCQIAVNTTGHMYVRYYQYRAPADGGNYWKPWNELATTADVNSALSTAVNNCLQKGKQYTTSAGFIADVPSNELGNLTVNRVYNIGATVVNASDEPCPDFVGTLITLSHSVNLSPGNIQIAIDKNEDMYIRYYVYRVPADGGNYWKPWVKLESAALIYRVGPTREYTSLTTLLLDLNRDTRKKVIYIDSGTYDIFNEYLAEITAGRISIPPDSITSADYMEPYNAFVPSNTRIFGYGTVILQFTPSVADLESMSVDPSYTGLGASKTWSPLNVLGEAEIENLIVIGKNCRYCLHNDAHGQYKNTKQHYKNVRFLYTLSDLNSASQRLGFNMTVGFGIYKDCEHVYEDCEFYIDATGNYSAFYGHEGSGNNNGTIILKNCVIHSSDFTDVQTIRLQTLAKNTTGRVKVLIENCYVNGGLYYHLYYSNSIQSFDVRFVNSNLLPVTRVNRENGAISDPYTTTWFNPLDTPTAATPLISTDTYS